MHQDQFLTVIDRDEAERRFRGALRPGPKGVEEILVAAALGRVAAADIRSPVDVPSFDRSNVDGFAVRAADTFGAAEYAARTLTLLPEVIATALVPKSAVGAGEGMTIATGGMLPRGADAVVMIEHTDAAGDALLVRRAVHAGQNISYAATDIAAGETVLHAGHLLTSRETGVLAAVGLSRVPVFTRPRVGILSTGDELLEPGAAMQPAFVFDSNARVLADAVREQGCEPISYGIVHDDRDALRARVVQALAECDAVLLSGGTSKGAGDISYHVVREFTDPGIVAHGVALKPGKPICLAVTNGKPLVVLPGFPTSAIFTFHEFVAPVLRDFAGRASVPRAIVPARLAVRVNSEIGRTEFLLVGLVRPDDVADGGAGQGTLAAFPMGKGSGSVTAFSRADGFVTIDRHQEILEAGAVVDVQLLGGALQPADLVVIGSHCLGLDYLLSRLERDGVRTKFLAVGSLGGLEAVTRGECDLAGIHLLDPETGEYNRPFLPPEVTLIPGYAREQGFVFRPGDSRFAGKSAGEAIQAALTDPECRMVNRNAGSGTRVLIDRLLAGVRPAGYSVQTRNHPAVAAAVAQHRADWGVCIRAAAEHAGLEFIPVQAEHYDFAIRRTRLDRPAVRRFVELLQTDEVVAALGRYGFQRYTR